MNCRDLELLLADYLGEEVDAAVRAEIHAHLESCAACRDDVRGLAEVVSLLRQAPEVPEAAALARVSGLHVVRRWSWTWRLTGALLKTAAVLALGIWLGRRGSPPPAAFPELAAAPVASPPTAVNTAGATIHPAWIDLARQTGLANSSFAHQLALVAKSSGS